MQVKKPARLKPELLGPERCGSHRSRCMKRQSMYAAVALWLCAIGVTLVAQATKIDFEHDESGKPPKGFSFALTGQGKPGVWIVRKDDAAHGNVLAQTDADTTDYRFPVAVYDNFTAKDVDLAVQFKPVSGKGDQGAGLVWRYRDQNNYYITRCN